MLKSQTKKLSIQTFFFIAESYVQVKNRIKLGIHFVTYDINTV